MSFILPGFTINKCISPCMRTTAVQSVVEPCNIAEYLYSKKLYFQYLEHRVINIGYYTGSRLPPFILPRLTVV